MYKNPVTIISFFAFLVMAIIQAYMIDEYYTEKSNNFDTVYSYAVRHSIENSQNEPFNTQMDLELENQAMKILNNFSEDGVEENSELQVQEFHSILRRFDPNKEIIKEYLVSNSLDSVINPSHVIRSIQIFDFRDTFELLSPIPSTEVDNVKGIFIKNYDKEGNNYRIQYAYNLDFTQKRRLILKEMQGLLLGAFLTLVAVLSTFLYTLIIIQKQKKLSALKDDLIDNISHEFKTPLTSIAVATATIKQSASKMSSEQLNTICNTLSDQNKILTNMIDYVIDVSVLDRGPGELNRTMVKVKAFISDWIEALKANLEHEGLQVDITLDLDVEDDIRCNIDTAQITKVLSNLVNNAIKYADKRPEIRVLVTADDDFLLIDIEDNGPGISLKDQPFIFDKFYRGEVRSKKKGLGLGLYITKNIIDKHLGTILLDNTPGQGTTFKIKLPKR